MNGGQCSRSGRRWTVAAAFLVLTFLLAPAGRPPVTAMATGGTTRVSVASNGAQGDYYSALSAISADGRFVVFESGCQNFVANDTNLSADVFVHDRQTGQTTRVSITSAGRQAIDGGENPDISADGRYVTFESKSDDLVANDTNNRNDIFVHDRQTGQTTLVSVNSAGKQVFADSQNPSISGDGRYVVFESSAATLVPGDENGVQDVFVHDRQTGETSRVSVSSSGVEGQGQSASPAISADGRYVAFQSDAANLTNNDSNQQTDVFVRDRQAGQTIRVSMAPGGEQGNGPSHSPSLSSDGRLVAFVSGAENLFPGDINPGTDIFIWDHQTQEITLVSVATDGTQRIGYSHEPAISADGRYVTFTSGAELVSGYTQWTSTHWTQTFLHDLQTGETLLVSVSSEGEQANRDTNQPVISADGRFVSFSSGAGNLVPGDTNEYGDVFINDRQLVSTLSGFSPIRGSIGTTVTITGTNLRETLAVTFSGIPADNLDIRSGTEVRADVPDGATSGHIMVTTRYGVVSGPNDFTVIPGIPEISSFEPMSGPPGSVVILSGAQFSQAQQVSFSGVEAAIFHANASTRLTAVVPVGATTGPITIETTDGSGAGAAAFTVVPYRLTGFTRPVTLAQDGELPSSVSTDPALSNDGRYVAFESQSSNLVPGDNNGLGDSFVHDRYTGLTTRVSVTSTGGQANSSSGGVRLSSSGRFVVFSSYASNLVVGDSNHAGDVFVHDRQMGTTSLISAAGDGTSGNDDSSSARISADGHVVAFVSEADNLVPGTLGHSKRIYVRDLQAAKTNLVAETNLWDLSLSANGRFIAFASERDDLGPRNTNYLSDIFVMDRQTGDLELVSVASDGTQGNGRSVEPSISADGRLVAFFSSASNLVNGDSNEVGDIFVHDRQTGQTFVVSVSSTGEPADGPSERAAISANGRVVTFNSSATNLASNCWRRDLYQVYVHNLLTGRTSCVSIANDGSPADTGSRGHPALSGDGQIVAFESFGISLLPPGEHHSCACVFIRERESDLPLRAFLPFVRR